MLGYLSLGLGAVGLGWLMGMTISPIMQGVITALLAFAVASAQVLAALRRDAGETTQAAHGPPHGLAVLLLGIAAGAAIGIVTRTHEWLAPSVDQRMAAWKATGYDSQMIARRLFDARYPVPTAGAKNGEGSSRPPADQAVLFDVTADQCADWRRASQDSTRRLGQLQVAADRRIDTYLRVCATFQCERAMVELLCTQSSRG